MRKLIMEFSGETNSELVSLTFVHPLTNGQELKSVRGKTSGAFLRSGSFQWTKAVRALSVLFLKYKLRHGDPYILGHKGTLASSLDGALQKNSLWISDFFGVDQKGRPNAKRLLLRTNPGMKRPGPVAIALNPVLIDPSDIEVTIVEHEKLLPNAELTKLLSSLEQTAHKFPKLTLAASK